MRKLDVFLLFRYSEDEKSVCEQTKGGCVDPAPFSTSRTAVSMTQSSHTSDVTHFLDAYVQQTQVLVESNLIQSTARLNLVSKISSLKFLE